MRSGWQDQEILEGDVGGLPYTSQVGLIRATWLNFQAFQANSQVDFSS